MIYTQEQLEAMDDGLLNSIQGDYSNAIVPCNSWNDCGKLIDGLAINLYKTEGPDFMPWIAAKGVISSTQHNPKKAVVIVYILVNQAQQND